MDYVAKLNFGPEATYYLTSEKCINRLWIVSVHRWLRGMLFVLLVLSLLKWNTWCPNSAQDDTYLSSCYIYLLLPTHKSDLYWGSISSLSDIILSSPSSVYLRRSHLRLRSSKMAICSCWWSSPSSWWEYWSSSLSSLSPAVEEGNSALGMRHFQHWPRATY